MQTTGELIRLLGYVDDIAATLRRIDATIPTLTPEERKRLAEYMRKSDPNFISYSRHWKREAISGRSVPRSATTTNTTFSAGSRNQQTQRNSKCAKCAPAR